MATVRDRYVRQFGEFAKNQLSKCDRGAAEVKIKIGEAAGLFNSLYCVDFIINDGQSRIVELAPNDNLPFDPIESKYGTASLSVRCLQWDDVVLRHDLDELSHARLEHWFERWFDPDDSRYQEGAEISRVVHSLLVQPRLLSIDFGTAEPAALWEILELLENAGASSINIGCSRVKTEPDE